MGTVNAFFAWEITSQNASQPAIKSTSTGNPQEFATPWTCTVLSGTGSTTSTTTTRVTGTATGNPSPGSHVFVTQSAGSGNLSDPKKNGSNGEGHCGWKHPNFLRELKLDGKKILKELSLFHSAVFFFVG